jgi:hypothetical protein
MIKDRISEVCHKMNKAGQGVMNPLVCQYCFGCPIATIVEGVSGDNMRTGRIRPREIPEKDQPAINEWLDKVEAGIK